MYFLSGLKLVGGVKVKDSELQRGVLCVCVDFKTAHDS